MVDRVTLLYIAVIILLILVVRLMMRIEGFSSKVPTPQWVLDKQKARRNAK